MAVDVQPRRDLRFVHARALDVNNQPVVMRVTAVRQGLVFYRGDDGKGSWKIREDKFPTVVGKVLQ